MAEQNTDAQTYLVVLNDEEQYSIWWAERELPAGWHAEGTRGTKEECLAHIGEIWTDMRPLSLRRRMAEAAG
ncbi:MULTISPECIES: MbtH family protein [Streptomyces]|uniref:MbtH family protein n=1 Tax=Streptomyces TaxID=1883 RepID=UPI0013278392|nr:MULTISPECIES: MbtH family NRPS accessory protein [Streptomyces]MWA14448.1 MbtH family NRPS accessory protein [Streptomyces sp. BA2]UFQ18544.1 MbtH family NRPS accessory protein [Streptomyces huasconensis]WCL88158.1 MbtH family NRPS accessory protein [Streptomyces sp. JCM 35825]